MREDKNRENRMESKWIQLDLQMMKLKRIWKKDREKNYLI